MGYKTILVQVDLDGEAGPRLRLARQLADRFEAKLIGFAAAEADLIAPVGDTGTGAAEAMRLQVEEIERRLAEIEAETLKIDGKADWLGLVDDPSGALARHARAADLIVTGPCNRRPSRSRGVIDPGTLIMSAGRPVLVPAEDLAAVRAENIVVAWKDAREARRAVADAMPFLAAARRVAVATIDEDDTGEARQSVADVVAFLARHGVKAEPMVINDGKMEAIDAIGKVAAEIGADLGVGGGYGPSRLREWAFGGMTRSLLGKSGLHRLFSN
jgi:nucleotide-binding universal stress UspA family protein